jgi:hypothetical protein
MVIVPRERFEPVIRVLTIVFHIDMPELRKWAIEA